MSHICALASVSAAACLMPAAGNVAFQAGSWNVRYFSSTSMLRLSHPASGTVVEGELSCEDSTRLVAATNRLLLADDGGRTVGGVSFPHGGDRIGLLVFATPDAPRTLFFEGSVQFRDDAMACRLAPLDGEHVHSFAVGAADSLLNDALYSPSRDEALVVRGGAPSFTAVDAGKFGFDFSISSEDAPACEVEISIERDFYRTRWAPDYRPGAPLPAKGWLKHQMPPLTGKTGAGKRRMASAVAAIANRAGVRPLALYPHDEPLPVWDLAVRRPFGQCHRLAIFNWSGKPSEVTIDWDVLGEDQDREFIVYEQWGEAWLGVVCGRLTLQVPPHDARFVALEPYAGHPQFLAPGTVSAEEPVKEQTWAEDVLCTKVAVSAGTPVTVRYALPDSFIFDSVRVPKGVEAGTRIESGGHVLAVTLESAKSRDVEVELKFR